METMRGEIFERVSRSESRLGSSGNAGRPVEPTPETFANTVRKTLQESKKGNKIMRKPSQSALLGRPKPYRISKFSL